MQFSLRALFLAILSVSISALWASNSQAEYWSHPFIGKCRDSGFACARKVSIAVYGADQTFSRCNYIRADYYGYLVMAECKGSRGWGMVNLNCESGEVKSTNGCISAPIVDKDPPCESQAGNPVDASSGMKLEYVLDFTTAGPLPLKFERHYRSETNTRDGEYKTSRLGTGWRSNFDGAMFYYSTSSHPSSSLRFVLPDGTFYSFKTSNGAYVQRYYSWTKKEWVNQSVNRSAKAAWNSSAQRYELTTPDDTLWSFDTSVWEPFGTLYSLNGSVNLDARFPGQWYQLETGLHYNWHRHYDPTLGRYTRADPVGMPDVPNRFAYARSNPMMNIDPDGKQVALPIPGPGIPLPLPPVFIPGSPENEQFTKNTLGGIQKIIQLCRRSLGFGGGNDNDEPDCHDRYEREMQSCHKRRWKMAHPHYFNGCLDRAADRRSQCIRNGGRPAPGELSEWSDADEETWVNPFE